MTANAPTSGISSKIVRPLVERIEACFTERNNSLKAHNSRCAQIKSKVELLYEEARQKGVPVKGLKNYIASRQRLRALRQTIEALPPDQQQVVQLIAEANGDLNDLPLFKFAIDHAKSAADLEQLMARGTA